MNLLLRGLVESNTGIYKCDRVRSAQPHEPIRIFDPKGKDSLSRSAALLRFYSHLALDAYLFPGKPPLYEATNHEGRGMTWI
ncbi:MAG: hypothetical protein EA367_05835 [Leptolyngbya sp. DLM2.Bin15]|nr:MAG: hypothetical protein EA367_05835 [Leptolyngbya sp. DLM2.Bin15]